ncbi:PadR family transcriptional regulator [Rhodoflexus sp.]
MNTHLVKGSLAIIILKLLEENRRMYGYEITQKVKELTAGQMQVTEGALYPALHKLEAEGLVTTESEIVEGRVRKYYSLTQSGETEAASRISELLASLQHLQLILNPKLA